jgi:Ca-activated chloride channel homolog
VARRWSKPETPLKFVLNNLHENDTFNIVAYDSSVETFRPELQRYDQTTRQAALGFVEGLYAGGATNIDGALTAALKMIHDGTRPSYILFLTDGLPTTGETNETKIVEAARQNNKHRARVISMGVGYDVNGRLLDRISRTNYGQSEYVRPDEDIERVVSRVYGRISEPVMTEVAIDFDLEGLRPEDGFAVNRVYPREIYDLFAGEQLVIVGRYRKPGDAKVTVTGKVGSETQTMDFPGKLVEKSGDESYAFIEKLWAMRRIGEIIEELDQQGKNEELVKELVELSTKHGILTPYTSFLADENARPELASAENRARRASAAVDRLSETTGRAGFAQRAERQSMQQATRAPMSSGYGGAMGGYGADMYGSLEAAAAPGSSMPARARSGVTFRDIETDREVEVESVQIVGNETLYKRGKQWIAANAQDVDLERDRQKIQTIDRFSDEYFRLVAANTASENAVLARQQPGEELVIRLRKQVYLIR